MTPALPALLAQMDPESIGIGIGVGFILLIALLILFGIASFVFWIWMLIDCAQAPEPPGQSNHRVVWILILVFTGWIGAILYFFIVRQPRLAALRARAYASPPPPPPPPTPGV